MLNDITVLITAAGNVFMPGTTACLRNNGERRVRLIGADMNNDKTILQMCDSFYVVPRVDALDYVDSLLDICNKERVDILLPIMSAELDALATNRSRFADLGTIVSVSTNPGLTIANDKLKLFDHLTSSGIRCARYFPVYSLSELEEASVKLGYPEKAVCVKATHGSGSRGFRILNDKCSRFDSFMYAKPSSGTITLKEMLSILGEAQDFPELMVMEYLPGNEYTVDLVADQGKALFIGCRQSLGMENSIMIDGVVVANKDVCELCQQVVRSLQLDGNIGFDLREGVDGLPYIMECNPRITAGIPIFYLAGVNLPYLNVKRLLGEPLPTYNLKIGKTVRRRWMEM